jgi:hypothetical protein
MAEELYNRVNRPNIQREVGSNYLFCHENPIAILRSI